MSYDIYFKVPVAGVENHYISVGEYAATITWNLKDMIVNSTGLEWRNDENNGLCKDVIPKIMDGLEELINHPEKYKQYEAENGCGTIHDCITFFLNTAIAWNSFCEDSSTSDLVDVTYFWIC